MSLHCGRRPEETHANVGRSCKLHTERPKLNSCYEPTVLTTPLLLQLCLYPLLLVSSSSSLPFGCVPACNGALEPPVDQWSVTEAPVRLHACGHVPLSVHALDKLHTTTQHNNSSMVPSQKLNSKYKFWKHFELCIFFWIKRATVLVKSVYCHLAIWQFYSLKATDQFF